MVYSVKNVIITAVLLLLLSLTGRAQVTVDIGASTLEGCAPLEVLFTSTVQNCTGAVNYQWDFGFSGGNSSQANPGTVFQNAGNYTVTLNVSCAAGNAGDNITIIVHQPPTAIISNTPVTGCRPLVVNFQDGSTPGDGTINSWEWFFNDGTPLSTLQNPQHIYDFSGIFNVLLIVRDNHNCSSQVTVPSLVSVSDTPSVAFTAFPLSYCQPPLPVNFQSIVTTSLNLSYQAFWSFGDGAPNGSGTSVQHTYTTPNIFDVTLTVVDAYGCTNSETYTDYINITELVPDFSMYVGSTAIQPGGVICPNTTVHFTNLTAYNCLWDFGGGQTSSLNIYNYSFVNPGTYNLRFTVQPGGECENYIDFQLFVEEVSAGFTTDPASLTTCNVPFEVDFTSTSSANVASYNYTFGDGESSAQANTSHTYQTSGTYPVVLTVTSVNGCIATTSAQVIIHSPDATFAFTEGEGCAPLLETFNYTGTSGSTITGYTWNFGDGSPSVEQAPPVAHTFQNAGEYTVTLTVTDGNCTSSSTQTVNVGNPIESELTFMLFDEGINDWYEVTELEHCAQDTFRIYNSMWDNPDVDEFEWLLDSIDDDSDEEYLEWAFDQDTGYVSVMLVTNFNGCRDTLQLDSIFYINGPVIESIQKEFECGNPFDYTFTVNITHPDDDLTLAWDWFIDEGETGSDNLYSEPGSTDDQISFTFPGYGVYWARVRAYSTETGCDFVDSVRVDVIDTNASFFVSDNEVCSGATVYFDATASSTGVSYAWDFGDGASQEPSDNPITNHVFEGYGDFIVTLTVIDNNNCEFTAQQTIHVSGPVIQIVTDPDPAHGCNSLNVTFSFTYQSDYPLSYNVWQVSGSPQSYYSLTFEKQFAPGTYDVSLTVSNTNGCSATVTEPGLVVVSSIEAAVTTLDPVECVNVPVQFYAGIDNPALNYHWDFGDGETSTAINPEHAYTDDGIFTATLQIDDGFGCTDVDEIEVEVQGVDVDFDITQTVYNCYPAFLDINNHTEEGLYSPSWQWTFGTGDTLPVYEPQDFFIDSPGLFWVKLEATTAHGCIDADSVQVTINGPVFNYYYLQDTICLGDTVHFEITNMQGDYNIRWYIRGIQYTSTTVDFIFSDMPPDGFTEVQLIVEFAGCQVTRTLPVYVQQVIAGFVVHDSLGNVISASCSPFEFDLINATQGADTVIWTVAGTDFAGTDTLPFSMTNNSIIDSLVNVRIFGQNELGCTDTATQTITIYGQPDMQIIPDTLICLGDQIALYVTGGPQVLWSPNEFINDVNSLTPIIEPDSNIIYYARLTDENGCIANDSVQIWVQQIPEFEVTPVYDTIIIGDTVFVTSVVDQEEISYVWTPAYEISCTACPNPWLTPKENQRYTVVVEDSSGCFRHNYYVDIYVIEQYSLDVPSAFTPLGHETNRIVYAKGYGIKHFIEFRIYNRWGEEVFFTDDINVGWDGYHKGELQNIDTYKFFVRAEMWNGEIYVKTGDILLMR